MKRAPMYTTIFVPPGSDISNGSIRDGDRLNIRYPHRVSAHVRAVSTGGVL